MSQEKRSFQAEVSRLLDIVAHSLYSEKQIFLRELISNASDACDRLRYAALTEPSLAEGDANYRVVLTPVKSSRTLTIADNGIGMNHDELIENLGNYHVDIVLTSYSLASIRCAPGGRHGASAPQNYCCAKIRRADRRMAFGESPQEGLSDG